MMIQLPKDRLDYLTSKIRANELTRSEEDELVKNYMKLLIKMSRKYTPNMWDVLYADGLFAILQAIRQAPKKLRPECSLTQFVIVKIKTAFKKAFIDTLLVKTPLSDRKSDRIRKNGKVEKKGITLLRHALPSGNPKVDEKVVPKRLQDKMIARMDQADLREIFNLACEDSYERAILELKKAGYTQVEIAEQMGTTRIKVAQVLNGIEDRLRVLLGEE